ncbi:Piso0_004320 [Millerozyma farinosa CBS 7064]|uniref:Piso0_004320 protein n=1 Tax=Pichia sorbitophila (strain ATCC MYA-4447 / BCRC 22081 / CBS 7064 / NBRC 10061 / NRRL Y-12695) TaxID=559304 RepID=G8Y835_PICSO|nr:Piso0_004320 [Millerozyma farinosa CBS 7064]CCE84765.1 Piso0_004320 [Millerozyma farinosa CBS 7064]
MKLNRIFTCGLFLASSCVSSVAGNRDGEGEAVGRREFLGEKGDIFEIWQNEDRSPEQLADDLTALLGSIEKRDNSRVDQLTSILQTVNRSGVIFDILHEIAGSRVEQDNLINATTTLLNTGSAMFGSYNISLNTSNILNKVMSSGLIQSVADGLLLNEKNRVALTVNVGEILRTNAGMTQLLIDLGHGHDLTVDFVADRLLNTKTKNPKYQHLNEGKQTVLQKRDGNYSGSADKFFNNLIQTILQSNLVSESTDDILQALNNSGIIVPIVLRTLNDTAIANMGKYMLTQLYYDGAFDGLDLNKYFKQVKENHALTNGVEYILTDPTYSPALAAVFKQMDDAGVYRDVQTNIYGP